MDYLGRAVAKSYEEAEDRLNAATLQNILRGGNGVLSPAANPLLGIDAAMGMLGLSSPSGPHLDLLPFFQKAAAGTVPATTEQAKEAVIAQHYLQRMQESAAATAKAATTAQTPTAGIATTNATAAGLTANGHVEFDRMMENSVGTRRQQHSIKICKHRTYS